MGLHLAGYEVTGVDVGDEIPNYGNGTPSWHRTRFGRGITIEEKRLAMGIDWMNRVELAQAIPPKFSEWFGLIAAAA